MAAFMFETEQWLPYPVELVFAFFANPENLPRLMPRWQQARIEEAVFVAPPPRPEGAPHYPGIAAGTGTRLILAAKPFPYAPFRLPWEAQIEDFHWNEEFCDVQLRGPFVYWKHCHSVRAGDSAETGQPGTWVRDEVEYVPRGGALANLAISPGMRYTFRYRQRRAAELLPFMTGRPLPE